MPDNDQEQSGVSPTADEALESPILQGVFEVRMDDRWRIVIPAQRFKQLGKPEEVLVGPTPDGASLYVFARRAWQDWVRALREARADGDVEAGWLLRLFTSLYSPRSVQGDKHRVQLGEALGRVASLAPGDAVCVAGKDDRLHVLSKARWEDENAELLDAAKRIPKSSKWWV